MAKTKYMMHDCAYCHRQAKMEYVGSAMTAEETQTTEPQKVWYRCTRCKHSMLITLDPGTAEKKSSNARIDRNQCIEYSKDKTFTVGQEIYFSDLDDVGRVVRKDKTSNGIHSITVSFEKVGERKLLESVAAEFPEEPVEPVSPAV